MKNADLEITCRVATIYDVEEIRNLVQSRVISKDSRAITGLRGYSVPSVDKYRRRLNHGTLLVATANEKIVGFADSYRSHTLPHQFPSDPVVEKISELHPLQFSYNNTIVLSQDYEGTIASRLLMQGRLDANRGIPCLTAIMHEPLLNEKSIAFVKKFGFEQIGSVRAFDGYTFGIYLCKNL